MSFLIFQTALDNGLIYALIALSLFISFSILNICDLSTDGCCMLGAAVGVSLTISGHPVLALFCAMLAGAFSGFITAFLQTRLRIQSILAGIIVNTGLYTVNLAVMGMKTSLNIVGKRTVYDLPSFLPVSAELRRTVFLLLLLTGTGLLLFRFLGTRLGLSIRAAGDSTPMVRASSINPAFTITAGLCIANALTGLAGCLLGQYNKNCEINMATGIVTIALASLVIGRTLTGQKKLLFRIFGVIAGSVLYRMIIALALRLHIPAQAFKLVSALIVAAAIAAPSVRESFRQDLIRKRAQKEVF